MSSTRALFPTLLHQAELGDAGLLAELERAALWLADEDAAGRVWCDANAYPGYTSYASLDDLPARNPAFSAVRRRLSRELAGFARDLALDLGPRGRLRMDSLWVNVLAPGRAGGAAHSGHIHPHSVISGTLYVAAPPGSGAIRFEDPRLPLMMAAPPRRSDAPESQRAFVSVTPRPGLILLWESWLRHEVLAGAASEPRISLSFNYAWS